MNWPRPSIARSLTLKLSGLSCMAFLSLHALTYYALSPTPLLSLVTTLSIIVIYCSLSFLIIKQCLQPLKHFHQSIKKRYNSDEVHLNLKDIPKEIHPLDNQLQKIINDYHERMKTEARFAANAAHELRTPLATLYTHTQVALKTNDIQTCHECLNDILKCVHTTTHLIEQLLDMSKAGPNYSPDKACINLYLITQETIADIAPKALQKDTDISLIAENKTCMVEGNTSSLKILIRNLVDNAITYTPPKSTISIKISNTGKEHILLQVIDNGPGIPKKEQSKVFDRFYRVHSGTGDGCGLGLSIAKQIALCHHAKISLKQALPKGGLVAQVEFPISQPT